MSFPDTFWTLDTGVFAVFLPGHSLDTSVYTPRHPQIPIDRAHGTEASAHRSVLLRPENEIGLPRRREVVVRAAVFLRDLDAV